jgi:hypothetical protein
MKLLKLLNNGGNLGGNAANIEAAGMARSNSAKTPII